MTKEVDGSEDLWNGVRTVEASKARQNFRSVVERVSREGSRFVITRNGQAEMALISLRDLMFLLRRDAVADQRSSAALAGRSPSTVGESRLLGEALARRRSNRDSLLAPVSQSQEADLATVETVDVAVAQAATATARCLDATKIARKASERMVELVKAWNDDGEYIVDDAKEKEIGAELLETVQLAVVDIQTDEAFREQVGY